MSLYTALAICAPITIVAIISVTVYIRISTQRLYDEMRKRGLLLDALPVIVPYNILPEEGLRSPITGLPPPPPYTLSPDPPAYKP
ncbi:hypothetical protein Trydic_g21558 [Trypoxylus dichotomus]